MTNSISSDQHRIKDCQAKLYKKQKYLIQNYWQMYIFKLLKQA